MQNLATPPPPPSLPNNKNTHTRTKNNNINKTTNLTSKNQRLKVLGGLGTRLAVHLVGSYCTISEEREKNYFYFRYFYVLQDLTKPLILWWLLTTIESLCGGCGATRTQTWGTCGITITGPSGSRYQSHTINKRISQSKFTCSSYTVPK